MRRSGVCRRCGKTTSQQARTCVGCGGPIGPAGGWRSLRTRQRLAAFLVALATAGVLAATYSDTYMPAVTDWYLDMTVAPDGTLD